MLALEKSLKIPSRVRHGYRSTYGLHECPILFIFFVVFFDRKLTLLLTPGVPKIFPKPAKKIEISLTEYLNMHKT